VSTEKTPKAEDGMNGVRAQRKIFQQKATKATKLTRQLMIMDSVIGEAVIRNRSSVGGRVFKEEAVFDARIANS